MLNTSDSQSSRKRDNRPPFAAEKPAILLIGPTGSGKTPLGQYIEANGIFNRRFAHFDFGELLRQIATGKRDCNLPASDISRLKAILDSGALLEADTFYLAEKIISHFNTTTTADAILLNGLPRHEQQAKDISPWFSIRMVIRLACDAQTVFERIESNAGKDRSGRADDGLALIKQKLIIFNNRTVPLCEWFASKGISVMEIPVDVDTQPDAIVAALETKKSNFTV